MMISMQLVLTFMENLNNIFNGSYKTSRGKHENFN